MSNTAPNISVTNFVEDLFKSEQIDHPAAPASNAVTSQDKAILKQEVSEDFISAIVEGKDPTTTIKEAKKQEIPAPAPETDIIEEEVRSVKQCVVEFKLLMAQARGLLEEMTTVGMLGVGPGKPLTKKPVKSKGKRSTKDIVERCWKGYEPVPGKVPYSDDSCRKKKAKKLKTKLKEVAAWQKKSGKNPEGGLNAKGRASYERENPGSDLKAPQPEGGSRKKSFCARMKGMRKRQKDSNNTGKDRLSLSLKKWDC
tara:strand:- start:641 stop:1405 length:765 start_codon:yes stop_codon:yes gene_type:complete